MQWVRFLFAKQTFAIAWLSKKVASLSPRILGFDAVLN